MKDVINLHEYQVIDNHCHAFLPQKEEKKGVSLAQHFQWAMLPEEQCENLILYKRVLIELARVLKCKSKKPHDIIAQRNKAYPPSNVEKQIEYLTKLFDDAKITWLFFDTGYPSSQYPHGYDVDEQTLSNVFTKQKFRFILRLERLMWDLFKKSLPFDEMLDEYLSTLTRKIRQEKYIGLKSAIAYGYGLDINDHDIEEARSAYENLRRKNLLAIPLKEKMLNYPTVINEEKILRDFLTCRGIEKSIELNVPIQIHTGLGEAPIINVHKCNPVFLYDILRNPKLEKAKFVLIHAGYPYVEELAWLAFNFPNVYVDLSCMTPWIHFGIKQRLLQILEMTPVNKIMYGSDGTSIPEKHWIAAILAKESISKALQDLISSGFIDEDYAYKMAEWILSENAKRLYGLK
ncbi:MAG: amidohydrolase family protein [Candidatus Bathyarchaeia archaeon]